MIRAWVAFAIGMVWLLAIPGAQAQRNDDQAHQVLARVAPLLEAVINTRGLQPDHEIPTGIHTRESLRATLIEKIDAEMSAADFAAEARVYQRLGVLEEDTDYRQIFLDLLASQIAGFYDDESGELFLLDDLPPATIDVTLAHELFHGIQDQVFGLAEVRGDWPDAEDAAMAATALVEGDAVAVMVDSSLGGALSFTDIPNFIALASEQIEILESVSADTEPLPSFILDGLLFPYMDGLAFIHHLKSVGNWALVDAAYADPPLSTEQILHPARYLDRDEPTWIQLDLTALSALAEPESPLGPPGQAGAPFERVYDQILGEARWNALFRQVLGETVAARAIANATDGWDGDRLVGLEGAGEALLLVSLSVWDSSGDAQEFAGVLRRFVETNNRPGEMSLTRGENGSVARLEIDGRWVVVECWGDMVLYLDGPLTDLGRDTTVEWREEIWRGRRRSTYQNRASELAGSNDRQ